jgi:hypothetical protein
VTYSKFPDSLFDELEEWFQKGFSSATSERNANMYSILHKHKKETPHQLTIYDIAGEAFGDLKSDQQQQQFKYCEGIIFVIDPDASPNSANGTILSFTDEFKELRGAHAKKLSKIPLAVIISKSDLFEQEIGLQKIQSRCPNNAGQDDLENTRNAVCREFLINHGFGNVVNLIDATYDNVRYFPVSAMGHKAATGQSYNPWGVIEPVMWLLSYTKTSFKKIVTWLQTNKYPEAYLNVKKFIIRLLVLGLIGFIVFYFIQPIQLVFSFVVGFVQANLISVLIALGICIVCTLLCFYAQKKSKVPEFRLLLNILFSIGFIWLVFNFHTIRNINILDKLQQMTANWFKKEAVEEVVPQEEPKAIYALVVPDGLNVRSRPSDTGDIIGVLYKNSRIEVVDSSGIWWKIKFRDIEGYVFSDLVRLE